MFMSRANLLVLFCVVVFVFARHAVDAQEESSHSMGDSSLEVSAYWEPGTDSWLKLYKNSPYAEFFNLKPAHPAQTWTADGFNVFLPPSEDNLAVGDVWQFDIEDTLPFLRQFHPGATVDLSGRRGAFACLRAVVSALCRDRLPIPRRFQHGNTEGSGGITNNGKVAGSIRRKISSAGRT